MKKRNLLMVAVGVVFILIVGGTLALTPNGDFRPSRSDGLTPGIGGSHSIMPYSFDRVTEWTDAVVLGTVTAKTTEFVPCCQKMAERWTTHFPNEPPLRRLQESITFTVESGYKGNLPSTSTITIKAQKPGEGTVGSSGDEDLALMDFQEGQKYVLFLVARDGYYRVQSYSDGMWTVDGSDATQLVRGETLTLTEINDKVR